MAENERQVADPVRLRLWQDRRTGGLQLSIESDSDPGGYRIFGPTFLGNSALLTSYTLTERDVSEIRHYLERTHGI